MGTDEHIKAGGGKHDLATKESDTWSCSIACSVLGTVETHLAVWAKKGGDCKTIGTVDCAVDLVRLAALVNEAVLLIEGEAVGLTQQIFISVFATPAGKLGHVEFGAGVIGIQPILVIALEAEWRCCGVEYALLAGEDALPTFATSGEPVSLHANCAFLVGGGDIDHFTLRLDVRSLEIGEDRAEGVV
jgi:hypothetical protein